MPQMRRLLLPLAAGIGAAAAIIAAPVAGAEPLLPQCEVTGGSSIAGGQTTDCASEGNVQIDATPPVLPSEQFYGFPGFGFV